MGVVKRRAVARARLDVEVDIPRLAAAIRKYSLAASARLGSDSYIHAAIVQEILAQIGFESQIIIGHAGLAGRSGGQRCHSPCANTGNGPPGEGAALSCLVGDGRGSA